MPEYKIPQHFDEEEDSPLRLVIGGMGLVPREQETVVFPDVPIVFSFKGAHDLKKKVCELIDLLGKECKRA